MHPDDLRENKILNQAKQEVEGFSELIYRFERVASISESNFIKKPPKVDFKKRGVKCL